jgi:hypothetical protein
MARSNASAALQGGRGTGGRIGAPKSSRYLSRVLGAAHHGHLA